MKIKFLAGMFALAGFGMTVYADNPVANRGAVVEAGNARFTMLTPRMVRIDRKSVV